MQKVKLLSHYRVLKSIIEPRLQEAQEKISSNFRELKLKQMPIYGDIHYFEREESWGALTWYLELGWKPRFEVREASSHKPSTVAAWIRIEPMNRDDSYELLPGQISNPILRGPFANQRILFKSTDDPSTVIDPVLRFLKSIENRFIEAVLDFDSDFERACADGVLVLFGRAQKPSR